MKAETVYLMVRVVVLSDYENISDTVNELETQCLLTLADTPKLKVVETEMLLTRIPNPKRTIMAQNIIALRSTKLHV
jgi:hypothetical protein